MKKQIGIWLDFKEAFIIDVNSEETKVTKIDSKIEFTHPGGGARSKTPWGPMDKISESKMLDRRTHQSTDYYKRILKTTQGAKEVFIFGPAEAKVGLLKMIEASKNKELIVRGYQAADAMTEKQKIATVRDFYKIATN